MAVDMFLKIEGIKGESRDDKHRDQIDILSYSWGASQSGSPGFGGGGAGKVQFQDFHFTTSVGKASPQLFLGCATGEHFKDAVLTARKAGGGQQEFLVIKMNDVLITSYQSGGSSGGDVPTDQFSLNFAKIDYEIKEQKEDGSLAGGSSAGWDIKKNAKV